jgi:outer membrane protein OmpA-like peptidoglycan-associated protein
MSYAPGLTTAPLRARPAPGRRPAAHAPSLAARGNQALLRRLQAKLAVGPVDDPLEREADRVADQVVRMADPAPVSSSPALQLQRKCAECEEEQDQQTLQKKSAGGAEPQTAPPIVDEVLRSPGEPLDAATRAFFEPRFGEDFSAVRVHADAKGAESARAIGALGYAVDRHIVFGRGQFAPGGDEGRRLIAHELTHVMQQRAGAGPALRRLGDPSHMPQVLTCRPATSNPPAATSVFLFPNLVTTLTAAQKSQIATLAGSWTAAGGAAKVRVDGFASTPGEDALNWQLSCDRAVSVKTELMNPSAGTGPGIPEGSITVFMHGETAEFGDEEQNRRATVFVDTPPPPSAPPPNEPDNPPPAQPDNPAQPSQSDGGTGAGTGTSCAKNTDCDPLYCAPFATRAEALQDRAANSGFVMSGVTTANSRAGPLFQKFIFSPGPAGDVSKDFETDFTHSDATLDATRILVKALEDAINATPPAFPPGSNTVTLDINTALGKSSVGGFTTINEFLEHALEFNDPLTVPGLIAGGVGKTQTTCKVGANTDGAVDDSRSASGTVTVTKNPDGTLVVMPDITYTVVDTLDFCPGNCGGAIAQILTIPLSRWEASAVSGDVPFTVRFPAPALIGAFDSEE